MTIYDTIYEEISIAYNNNKLDEYIENFDCIKNNITYQMLLFIVYDKFKYIYKNTKIEERIKRDHQRKFRKELENRYNFCIITGRGEEFYEACHIVPFCESDNKNMYDINNGILLSSELHKLFDKHLISINDNKVVISNKILINSNNIDIIKYNGKQLYLNKETCENLKQHYKIFLDKNNY